MLRFRGIRNTTAIPTELVNNQNLSSNSIHKITSPSYNIFQLYKYFLRKRDSLYEVAKCRSKKDERKSIQLEKNYSRKENKKIKNKRI